MSASICSMTVSQIEAEHSYAAAFQNKIVQPVPDTHHTIEMKKELLIKTDLTDLEIEDDMTWKYILIKQEEKGDGHKVVLDDESDIIRNQTFNPEGIKQDPENYCSRLDVKPVLKQELTDAGNEDSDDEQRLSLWSSHPTDAVSSTQHNSKDKQTLTSTDLLAMEMKSSGLSNVDLTLSCPRVQKMTNPINITFPRVHCEWYKC